jgi:hypothetical protein
MGWLCRNCEAWDANDHGRICEVCESVRPPDLRVVPLPARSPVAPPRPAPPRPAPPVFAGAVTPLPRSGRLASIATAIVVLLIVIIALRGTIRPTPALPVPDTMEPPPPVPVVEEPARSIEVTRALCTPGHVVSCAVDLKNVSGQTVAVRVQASHGRGRTVLALPDGTEARSHSIAGWTRYADFTLAPGAGVQFVVAFQSDRVPQPGTTLTLAWTESESGAGGTRELTQSLLLKAVDEAGK